ncbi:MAG: GGDEF domain-containing protein [Proteobacteria bacterium]|nr:GGDEF domain-containing protein [Pseudomonadota bacterium]
MDGEQAMKIGETKTAPYLRSLSRAAAPSAGGSNQAAAMAAAADSVAVMGIPETELTPKVRAAIMGLLDEVQRLRDELRQSVKRIAYLERLADQDSLLPVINRRAFVRELSRMLSFGERYGIVSSVLYFDINGMKAINDTHGHAAGDAALAQVAELLAENIRESDVVGRLGGDEFGVILTQADIAVAHEKAASLAAAIEDAPLIWKGREVSVGVAYGAQVFGAGDNADRVLDAADRAMYQRKQATVGARSA